MLAVSLCAGVLCDSAHAKGSFYYDLAGGIARYQQTSPFFGNQAQSTGVGYALNNGIFVNFGGETRAFQFQLGVQHRLSSAADTTNSYAIQAAYPVLRLQFSRIYLGAGYTPFVWKRVNRDGGLDYFKRADNTTALLLEAGLLMPITPKFSFGAQSAMQFVNDAGTRSPKPAWEATGSLRFYFGFFNAGGGGDESSGEFKGWRYPFGMIR